MPSSAFSFLLLLLLFFKRNLILKLQSKFSASESEGGEGSQLGLEPGKGWEMPQGWASLPPSWQPQPGLPHPRGPLSPPPPPSSACKAFTRNPWLCRAPFPLHPRACVPSLLRCFSLVAPVCPALPHPPTTCKCANAAAQAVLGLMWSELGRPREAWTPSAAARRPGGGGFLLSPLAAPCEQCTVLTHGRT